MDIKSPPLQRNFRIISRLDVKRQHLVKGIHLEGLRKLGSPRDFTKKYYESKIDEVLYMDVVASLYGRNSLLDLIEFASSNCFVPLTVGGGIRSVDDCRLALESGADKVAVNTAAIARPSLISDISNTFGSQCMVLSIEAKSDGNGGWEALFNNGREHSHLDAVEWAREGVQRGAGEILLTSVDMEGTCKGMDTDLLQSVSSIVDVPVIASGGVGSTDHVVEAASNSHIDGIALAHVLHYDELTVSDIKNSLTNVPSLDLRL